MDRIRRFFRDAVESLLKSLDDGLDEPDPPLKTYNFEEIKSGIMHARRYFEEHDHPETQALYDDVFRRVRVERRMDEDGIREQMSLIVDGLIEADLLTDEEQSQFTNDQVARWLTDLVISGIENNELEQKLNDLMRFEQRLRKPVLRVVRNENEGPD